MKSICFLIITFALAGFIKAEKVKPNIIILYADDMGVADVSYGDAERKIQTPNIDRLSASGMTFTDAHSSSGICTPSRYALLTGQHHWRRFHKIVNAFDESVFRKNEFTVARMLEKEGYTTGCFGKWHLGWDWDSIRKPKIKPKDPRASSYDWTKPFKGGPIDQGFDYYYGDGTINFPPYCWIENDKILSPPVKPVIKSEPLAGGGSFRKGPMAEDWDPYKVLPTVTQKTVDWIDQQNGEKPFFAYLAFNSPHYPIVPNKEFHGKSMAGYYGDFMVETDAMVGKVLDILEKKGIADNTIVIFTADNGAENLAFQRLEEFEHWSSGKFRGVKKDLYEGGHRVPFIVRWTGNIESGSKSNEVISQVDLTATLASIVGHKLSNDVAIDSYDFLPVWKGEEYESPLRTATVQNTVPKKYALRQGEWVYINTNTGVTGNSPQFIKEYKESYLQHFDLTSFPKNSKGLLFNLKEDPRQSENLYSQEPERVKEMNALLNKYIKGERCAPKR